MKKYSLVPASNMDLLLKLNILLLDCWLDKTKYADLGNYNGHFSLLFDDNFIEKVICKLIGH